MAQNRNMIDGGGGLILDCEVHFLVGEYYHASQLFFV